MAIPTIFEKWRGDMEAENARDSGGDRPSYWKIPAGRTIVRPMLFEGPGGQEFDVVNRKHFSVRQGSNKPVVCPGYAACPICKLKKDVSEKAWSKIKPSSKALINCIVRGDDGDELVIAEIPMGTCKKIKAVYAYLPDTMNGLDPEDGLDVQIVKTGSGLNTTYEVSGVITGPTSWGADYCPVDLTDHQQAPASEEELYNLAMDFKGANAI